MDNEENIIHPIDDKVVNKTNNTTFKKALLIFILVILMGVFSGYAAAQFKFLPASQKIVNTMGDNPKKQVEKVVGVADKKTFKDSASGVLKPGGIDGEGDFHLQRPGGESQNVYLTSTTIDLSEYINKKVSVWGETYSSEKAGWFMDVGLLEVE